MQPRVDIVWNVNASVNVRGQQDSVPKFSPLVIGVELKVGGSWHDSLMHTLDLPDAVMQASTSAALSDQEATSHRATCPSNLALPLPA